MGGSDDPSNIKELTIEEHAEAHKKLYEMYGLEEDRIAWLGLTGLISKSDVMKELYKLGRKKTDQVILEKYGVTNPGQLSHARESTRIRNKKLHAEGILKVPDWTGKQHTEESKRKIGEKNSVHQKGVKNSQYGTFWITNGVENKKLKRDEYIPEGWYKGRVKINASLA